MHAKDPTPKNEFFYGRDWSGVSTGTFIGMLAAYLRYYNEGRLKESLGWMSPMQFRRSLSRWMAIILRFG